MNKVVQKPMVLVVDDEPDICDLVSMTLAQMDVDTITAGNLTEARNILGKHRLSLCLADMRLPDGDGIDLVRYMQEHFPEIPVAVITAFGNVEGAVNTLKAGAFDYVSKPVNLKVLRDLVNTALRISVLNTVSASSGKRTLLGNSSVMEELRFKIGKLARSQAPVFICGASGTGKELVAQMIHEQGPRASSPFVPVNCGAIPSELVESEFFGHKKGSFTGAVANKDGLFQAAQGGTLFLDEVADLPLNMQVKLLRAIQEKAVRPVGSHQEVSVDVRILSATHKNLQFLVHNGEFRQDLFYRINVIELQVPGLSDRPEDIFILADHILSKISAQQNFDKPELSKSALDALLVYTFPGNIRELENILERSVTLCESGVIEVDDLQLPNTNLLHPADNIVISDNSLLPVRDVSSERNQPLEEYLDNIEKEAILAALEKTRWNKTAAARELGISFRALRYRLKKLNLDQDPD